MISWCSIMRCVNYVILYLLLAPPVSPRTFPAALVDDELSGDLFSAIFKSDNYHCSWKALLAHAIALHRPLLAILASCYEVRYTLFEW